LTVLIDTGDELGGILGKMAVEALGIAPDKVESYGKAAIVGSRGELEHAGAILHPKLGTPFRNAVGGGKAIIPSAKKMGVPGTEIDVPLHYKDAAFVRTHFDAMAVRVPDAPRPDEIVVVIVVTDSGLHQGLTRGFLRVRSERGLIAPADFQSMGFGVPAAIGAKIANPQRPVVLVIGDGGMALSGLELLTAVRERLDLTVVVFNDGQLGSIRRQQIRSVGRTHGVDVRGPDFAAFASAIGAGYRRLDADLGESIRASLAAPGVNLLEVPMADQVGSVRDRMLGTARRFKRGRRLGFR
jgi:hypothetical protein